MGPTPAVAIQQEVHKGIISGIRQATEEGFAGYIQPASSEINCIHARTKKLH